MSKKQKKYPDLVPFLKWAGGKRWLIKSNPNLLDVEFKRYIEPFVGSGAVYFHIQPSNAILADTNQALIDTYQAIREDWQRVKKELEVHHKRHSRQYYYAVRKQGLIAPHKRAAQLIYLNRTCWNGLFRVNLKGAFNVPIGTKNDVVLESDNFKAIAELLTGAELICSDFETIIDLAGKGDLLFVDPPYTVKHDNNGFIKYNEKLFSWEDQVRLKEALLRARNRGANIISTNANHASIKNIYKDHFHLESIKRHSILSAKSEYRGAVRELIIVG